MLSEKARAELETPAYVVDLAALEQNLIRLADVQSRAGCKILLALKGFAMWSTFGLVGRHLSGVTASSPHEARLGREHMGKEVHAYAPAWSAGDVGELITLADHLVFNSVGQARRFLPTIRSKAPSIECGLRINPEHSEVAVALYDPCAAGSRLGVTRSAFAPELLDEGIVGLHFHTLCELGADALLRTIAAVEQGFGEFLPKLRWVNMGGGHHITRPDYDVEALVTEIQRFRGRYGVEVYLEPGEAIALETGVLVASVLDVIDNEGPIVILDTSATAHMPDVLEMPYRPRIVGGGAPGERAWTCRLGGLTCLAGDVIGAWSFDRPLEVGDKLVFLDMAHYTMVKNTTFNGVRLPSIATYDPRTDRVEVVRTFGYEDYAGRLS